MCINTYQAKHKDVHGSKYKDVFLAKIIIYFKIYAIIFAQLNYCFYL